MGRAIPGTLRQILTFTALVEACTGIAVIIAPSMVATLLLGTGVFGIGALLGRCFGIALIALGLACWPSRESNAAALRAMLVYNALIALLLVYGGAVEGFVGFLLWPAILLHAALALLLAWHWRRGRMPAG